jgi:hypothetical protein
MSFTALHPQSDCMSIMSRGRVPDIAANLARECSNDGCEV